MGGSQEVGEVDGINLSSDSGVVPGRAGVFKNGASIGGDPDWAKRGSIQSRGGGAKVVDSETGFLNQKDFSDVEGQVGGVTYGDDRVGEQSGG